jgi:hypothetical protein
MIPRWNGWWWSVFGIEMHFIPCRGQHMGLARPPQRGPCHRKTETATKSLKMKVDGTACQDAGMGQSFPICSHSKDATSVA